MEGCQQTLSAAHLHSHDSRGAALKHGRASLLAVLPYTGCTAEENLPSAFFARWGDDGAPCVRRAPGTAPLAALLELRAAVLQT